MTTKSLDYVWQNPQVQKAVDHLQRYHDRFEGATHMKQIEVRKYLATLLKSVGTEEFVRSAISYYIGDEYDEEDDLGRKIPPFNEETAKFQLEDLTPDQQETVIDCVIDEINSIIRDTAN